MEASPFANGCEALLRGLMRDAADDIVYHHVEAVYREYEQHDAEELHDKFTTLLAQEARVRVALRTQDLPLLMDVCLANAPESIAGNVREILNSLRCGGLFQEDAVKKMWKRLKKLVIACGLHEAVYAAVSSTPPVPSPPVAAVADDPPLDAAARLERFNGKYREFLTFVAETFAADRPDSDMLTAMLKSDCVLVAFKQHVLPALPPLAAKLQENKSAEGVQAALSEYFGPDPAWFKALPLINLVPIDAETWNACMNNAETKAKLMKHVSDLMLCMSGIDALLNSPIVRALRDKTVKIMRRDGIRSEHMLPTSPTFNQAGMMKMVKSLIDEIPAATNNRISSDDLKTLLTNFMTGNDDVPESILSVFSPDMIDMDCMEVLTELPGIGDVLGPLMAGMEAKIKGTVGAPIFGAVEKPGWLARDDE